ncbi:MAG: glycosyltransferase family 2 protein [Chloroflexi bacterium]|nr:glycosyltransferase family 2 protein [Chloroflexota bacterium]
MNSSALMPSVTILIDTYNYARFIGRAIESALDQEYTGPRLQILVVDDGSTDNTAEVVRQYSPRVRYIGKANGGQASALNVGFREAEGDIVCLLDADDYFYSGKVQRVADAFRRHPEVGLVYDEFDIVDSMGASLGKVCPEPTWTGYRLPLATVPAQLRPLILLGHPWTCITSAMSVRRSVMDGLEVPEDVFPHSPDLFLGLVLPFLTEVAIIETAITAYVYHGDNVGLFRSSAANRATYERQMDYIRRYVEGRFGVRFLRYCGRSIYGPERDGRARPGQVAAYLRECRQIAAAGVDPGIKRRSQAKLAASLLLPDVVYRALRELRAKRRGRHVRRLRL